MSTTCDVPNLRCEIQWINDRGEPTPDANEAIAIAVSTMTYPDGSVNVRRFPCCAAHAIHLDALVARGVMVAVSSREGRTLYRSQWTLEDA